MTDLALSFRQPWLYFMLSLPPPYRKDIENRKTAWQHRGPLWFHSSTLTEEDFREATKLAKRVGVPGELIPPFESPLYQVGGIIGRGSFTGDLIHPSPFLAHPLKKNKWWMKDRYGYQVTDAEPVPFVACKGQLGLWHVPADVLEQLRSA